MIKKKNMPITGTNTAMRPKPPVLTDAKETSLDAQKKVLQPPMPFSNPTSTAQSPPASRASGGVSTLEPKILSGLKRTTPGAKANPSGGAVGYAKLPNQSSQIGGRMGFPPPRRKAGQPAPAAYKSKRNARFFGEK